MSILRTCDGHRGAALPELLFALSIFSLFLVGIFGLFGRGFAAFNFLQDRQSIHGELLRMKTTLGTDFRLTHFSSVGVEPQTATVNGQTVSRDNVCCITLDDWRAPSNFDGLGLPIWNRYFVYQCSTTGDTTRLDRLLIDSGQPIPIRVAPLNGLAGFGTSQATGRLMLSDSLESFECVRDTALQEVTQTVRLRKRGGLRGSGTQKSDEVCEAVFRWVPVNTVPRL